MDIQQIHLCTSITASKNIDFAILKYTDPEYGCFMKILFQPKKNKKCTQL